MTALAPSRRRANKHSKRAPGRSPLNREGHGPQGLPLPLSPSLPLSFSPSVCLPPPVSLSPSLSLSHAHNHSLSLSQGLACMAKGMDPRDGVGGPGPARPGRARLRDGVGAIGGLCPYFGQCGHCMTSPERRRCLARAAPRLAGPLPSEEGVWP